MAWNAHLALGVRNGQQAIISLSSPRVSLGFPSQLDLEVEVLLLNGYGSVSIIPPKANKAGESFSI